MDFAIKLAVFPFVWLAVLKALSLISGWNDLSNDYCYTNSPRLNTFKWYWFVTVWIGGIAHGGTRVGVNEQGLLLQGEFPFRPFHPPLFIPWEKILYGGTRRVLLKNYLVVIARGHAITILMPSSIIKDIQIAQLERSNAME